MKETREKLELLCFEHLPHTKVCASVVCPFSEDVSPVKPGTLPDLHNKDEENHRLAGEDKNQDPSNETLIEMTTESSLIEKAGKGE